MCLELRAIPLLLLYLQVARHCILPVDRSRVCPLGGGVGWRDHGPCRLPLRRHLVPGLLRGEGCQETRS